MVHNTDTAIKISCKKHNCSITDYTVAPILNNQNQEHINGLLNL